MKPIPLSVVALALFLAACGGPAEPAVGGLEEAHGEAAEHEEGEHEEMPTQTTIVAKTAQTAGTVSYTHLLRRRAFPGLGPDAASCGSLPG